MDPPHRQLFQPIDEYSLNGRAEIFDCYHNDTHYFAEETPVWSEELIETRIREARVNISSNQKYADSGTSRGSQSRKLIN